MARGTAFLLLTLAAIAQASLPNNGVQFLRRSSLYEQKGKPLCTECEKIVTGLKNAVDDPETEQKIRDSFTKVCNMSLGSKFQEQCFDLLNDIIVGIHEAQSILDNPTQVCQTLKLCAAEAPGLNTAMKRMFLSVISKVVQDAKQPSPLMAVDTCGLCTTALAEVKRFLEVPQVVEKIDGELAKVCKYLGKFESKCENFIETKFGKVFDWIVEALCQPEDTCAAIHLCPQKSVTNVNRFNLLETVSHPHLDRLMAKITAIQTARGFDVGCAACKVTVGEGIKVLTRDSVLTSLATDITDLVCKILPSSLRAGCFDFLGIYGKAALDVTFTNWTPEEICESMHACNSMTFQQLIAKPQIAKSVIACDACKAVTKTLAFELQQANVQQDIVNVLTQGCLLLPGKYAFKVRCQSVMELYIPYMLENIVALSYLPQACTVLHMC